MSQASVAISLQGVSKCFHTGTVNEVWPLNGMDLEVSEGAFLMILGGNGSGKSTLLNAIAGTFPIDQGRIHISGEDVTRLPEHKRARGIGRVFQNPFTGTAPSMTVAENLALAMQRGKHLGLGCSTSRSRRKIFYERVKPLRMDLEYRLDTPMGTLSGGQRQALTLLMATWTRPKLLLLDEHTAALDPGSASRILELTQSMVLESRLTTLMVTHSITQALSLGDRIILMDQGRIRHDFEGSAKKGLKPETLLDLFDLGQNAQVISDGKPA